MENIGIDKLLEEDFKATQVDQIKKISIMKKIFDRINFVEIIKKIKKDNQHKLGIEYDKHK